MLIKFTPKVVVLFFPKTLFVKRTCHDYPVEVARGKRVGSDEHTIDLPIQLSDYI